MGRLLLLSCCAFLAAGRANDVVSASRSADQPDFRNATWGMTRAQVLATEAATPVEIRESSGEWIVRYESIELSKLRCRVVYIFAGDKLVRAKYVFDADHSDPNDFIRDFQTLEPLLKDKYGKPVNERAFWQDDSFQDEPKSYLEQDRASSTDILPSDKFAGLSISAGHLKLYTQWRGVRTKVSHGLTGANSRITHQIEFLSVELEEFEGQVRGEAQPLF
jgi:hypothetical protein